MSTLMPNARCLSTTAVAESLKYIAASGWGEKSFEVDHLTVTFIPLDEFDVNIHRLGSLACELFDEDEITRAMKIPDPGYYVVLVDTTGVPIGYEYATRLEALLDYNALRARY